MAELALFGGSLRSQLIVGGIILGILWLWLFLYRTDVALRVLFGIFTVVGRGLMAIVTFFGRAFKKRR